MSVKKFYFILETQIPLFQSIFYAIESLHCIQNEMSLVVANATFYMEIVELLLKYSCYS